MLLAVEKKFRFELVAAKAWHDKVRADEIAWIKAGKDVDKEFARKYYKPSPAKTKQPTKTKAKRTSLVKQLEAEVDPW